jgi:hypothetical protein
MNINIKTMDVRGAIIPYKRPSIKKYGTMKTITLGSTGSIADVFGGAPTVDTPDTQKDEPRNYKDSPIMDIGGDAARDIGNSIDGVTP